LPWLPLRRIRRKHQAAFYRSFEREADYIAVQIMASAGFNPVALAAYLRRVQPTDRTSLSRIFATLPEVEERVSAVEKEKGQIRPGRNYSTGENLQEIQREVRTLTAR
jgi:predicted Zn-dependent protease